MVSKKNKFLINLLSFTYPIEIPLIFIGIILIIFSNEGIFVRYVLPAIFFFLFAGTFAYDIISDIDSDNDFTFEEWMKDWYKNSNIIWGFIGGIMAFASFLITYFLVWMLLNSEIQEFWGKENWFYVSLFICIFFTSVSIIFYKMMRKKVKTSLIEMKEKKVSVKVDGKKKDLFIFTKKTYKGGI